MSTCQAKVPAGFFTRLWMICGQPATATHAYRCACGHTREGSTCAAHVPAPGEVGCAQCFDEGHECPMEITEMPGVTPASTAAAPGQASPDLAALRERLKQLVATLRRISGEQEASGHAEAAYATGCAATMVEALEGSS